MNACFDGVVAGSNQDMAHNGSFALDSKVPLDFHDLFGLDVLQPAAQKLQISIPTVHVYGSRPRYARIH